MTAQAALRLEQCLDQLRKSGTPHALATVVRTVNATSAKPGAKAVILADGTIAEGWIGGGCARTAVGRAGAEAIKSGQTRFLSLLPEDLLEAEGVEAGVERDGIRFARNACPSKGSMDIFVEPSLPQPRLVVMGAGPVAMALSDLAARFDLHRTMAAPGLTQGPADHVQDGFALDAGTMGKRFLVVATQGKADEAGLRAALSCDADYVAFVGSKRKFATLAERLLADGVPPEAIARVKAPAGLDLHAITPEEIALSILAEITLLRRSDRQPLIEQSESQAQPEQSVKDQATPQEPVTTPRKSWISSIFKPWSAEQTALMAQVKYPCC